MVLYFTNEHRIYNIKSIMAMLGLGWHMPSSSYWELARCCRGIPSSQCQTTSRLSWEDLPLRFDTMVIAALPWMDNYDIPPLLLLRSNTAKVTLTTTAVFIIINNNLYITNNKWLPLGQSSILRWHFNHVINADIITEQQYPLLLN